jgi:DNA-binding response OmpR family regulator
VLLTSGYSSDERVDEILERGAAGFLQKPFDLYELSRRVHEILETTRPE